MRTGILAWLAGVIALQQLAHLPSPWLLWLLPVGALGMWRAATPVYRLAAWAMAGFLWSLAYAHNATSSPLSPALVGQDIVVEGYIASLPEAYPDVTRFEYDVRRVVTPAAATIPARIRLSWRNLPADTTMQPGELWQLTVRLKPPRGFYNPGSFDYEAWLLQKGVGATGYVRPQAEAVRLGSNRWGYPVQATRHWVRERLDAALAGQAQGRVVVALVLGVQTALSDNDWAVLRDTGTAHLLAISGLHISLIAGLIYWCAAWLWQRFPALTLRLAAPRAAAVAALLVAIGYSALAGFSIPTQRSCLMLVVVFGAILLNRQSRPSHLLVLALWIILLWDPLAVLAMGFWLSFGAVAIILFLLAGRRQQRDALWRMTLRMQFAICVGLIPLLIVLFEQVPVYSPLVNLLAVPWVTFIIVPLLLVGTLLLLVLPMAGQAVLQLGTLLIEGLWWVLEWAAALPYATVSIPSASWLATGVALAGLALLAMPAGLPRRGLAVVAVVPLLFPPTSRPDWGEAVFTLLDVGQGLAAVVQTRQHLLVFDTGPKFSDRFDTGEAVLVPFLRHHGYTTIDHLIISHGDNDHIGGVQGLTSQLTVRQASSSVPEKLPTLPVIRCEQGQAWEWDGINFMVLHPPASAYESGAKENDLSCVLRISAGDNHILLTGDIEAAAEAALINTSREHLPATLLVAPHHGSLTSSTPEFIQAVRPNYVMFATGQYNRYRFPRVEVISRYWQQGVSIYDTASSGAIRYWLRPQRRPHDPPQDWRSQMQRYWHQP